MLCRVNTAVSTICNRGLCLQPTSPAEIQVENETEALEAVHRGAAAPRGLSLLPTRSSRGHAARLRPGSGAEMSLSVLNRVPALMSVQQKGKCR